MLKSTNSVINATQITGTLPVSNGGTGATSATNARTNLNAAKDGVNADITRITALSDGGASDPAVTFLSESNTGIYRSGAGALAFSILGTAEATLSATGLNLASGNAYSINGTSVLSSTALGSGVVSSSLTSVGTLTSGALGSGFTTVAVGRGGTGITTATANGVIYGNATSAFGVTAAGTTGQVLVGNTGSAPSWATLTSTAVTSISFGTTGLTPSTATKGAITVAGTLVAANGGTGQSSYTIGDLLYASGATTLSKLADVATGNALISGGVGAAPSWGKINLTTHVTGTLPVTAGGTGTTTSTGTGSTVLSNKPSFGSSVGVGGAAASAAGAGMTFPAIPSLSSDPNTLDYYDEGTCNIVISDSSGNSATMGAANVFKYVRVGSLVFVSGTMNWTDTSALVAGSRIRFTGLPFRLQATANYRAPAIIGSSSPGSFNITRSEIAGGADSGETFVYGTKVSGNNFDGNLTVADLGNSGTIYGFGITYITDF